ncbi:reverse transcriptase zinc-binding domain-containing protein [Tanacetum coccineum]
MVTNRKKKGKQTQNTPARNIEGVKMNKPRSTFVYRPKISELARTIETESENIDLFKLKNQFDSLRNQDDTIMETEHSRLEYKEIEPSVLRCFEHGIRPLMLAFAPKDVVLFLVGTWTFNYPSTRRTLWSDLEIHKLVTRGVPWTLMGDFNVALTLEDYSSSSSKLSSAIRDFKECVYNIEVMDVNSSGLQFTWNPKPKGEGGLMKKLDRIMGNTEFIDAFLGSYELFQPYRISDHSPAVLHIPNLPCCKPKPFKFFNFLAHKRQFKELVSNAWNMSVEGHKMFQVVSKLKSLKKPFQKLLHDHGNLHDRVNKLRMELDPVQKALDLNPSDVCLREEEAIYVQAFVEAKLDEERFLKQKAKIKWLDVGDSNFAYFHMSVKCQNHRGRIDTIMNSANKEVTGMNVADVFVLGESSINMVKLVSDEEIKAAMFSIGDDRAPGPYGFSSAFFKKGWDIVGGDVCHAIRDFFVNGILLKEINHTFIAFIPKVPTPLKVDDFRPISCCNVLYKCISKILTNQIINGIKEVVSDNQSAFVLDDLFIFSRGDVESARVIMEALEEFKCTSGLVPSLPKSTVFFFNVSNHVKLAILSIMPFFEGDLPVKYLGVPLISLIRGFLWCNGELKRGRAKVAWDDICLPKQEGGLGLRRLDVFNMALMSTHIWNIGWLKLLQLREQVRPFLWVKLSNGKSSSIWYDSWCAYIPLINFISPRDIYREGFELSTQNLDVHSHDAYRWRGLNGSFSDFLVNRAWDAFRPRGNEVPWFKIMWFPHSIMRHSFHLCAQQDFHAHLFFECAYSSQVWKLVRPLADMESVQPILHDIISYIQPMAHKRTVRSIFGKLILAVATYFVWLERNNRLFKKAKCTLVELKDVIMITVRLKLLSFRFKNSAKIIPPRMRTRSAGRPVAKSLGGGTGERVGKGGRGRRPREGNDERVDNLNGQGNDQGMGANGGIEGAIGNVSNRGNVGNQNGNVVNENIQENGGNVIVNDNWVGCSYKEFLACNPKEYDGKGGAVVLTRCIEKMESVHDMSGVVLTKK